MITRRRSQGLLGNAWLATALSVAVLVLLGVLLWSPWDRRSIAGSRLHFYCAAGMTRPVNDIIDQYRRDHGVQVHPTYDGSGKLLSTITAAGGQGDLYLAADTSYMLKA